MPGLSGRCNIHKDPPERRKAVSGGSFSCWYTHRSGLRDDAADDLFAALFVIDHGHGIDGVGDRPPLPMAGKGGPEFP